MKYIAYYRVSTTKQGESGLGLEAQQASVLSYIRHNGNELVGEFTEVESGKNNERVELRRAIKMVKQCKGTLVIAKLDRLSRNVNFISNLMESKVSFVCCDMPDATELTIHIFAAIAQWERKQISRRTKEGLDAKRKREPNWRPGTNNLTRKGTLKGQATIKRNARELKPILDAWYFIKDKKQKGYSFRQITKMLNDKGYLTRTGKTFFLQQVWNIWKRFKDE